MDPIYKFEIEDFYKTIGQNVKNLRKEKEISQLEMATMIGQKSTSFLSNCENYKNGTHFNLEHLFLISKVLEVKIADILSFEYSSLNKKLHDK